MGDIERQLRWALICGIDVHWYALICGIAVALMGTGTWHFWGHTDHQGTLIISALMITALKLGESKQQDTDPPSEWLCRGHVSRSLIIG
ncbi:unnamed protein product, partial [Staurois parvus]